MQQTDKQDAILNTLQDLIRLRTVDGRFDEFEKAVRYVEAFFVGTPLSVEKKYFNKYPALIISRNKSKHPFFFLQGHLDVVDGAEHQFQPVIKGDALFGRGSVDMKGFDAIAMHLLKDLATQEPAIDAGMMLTFDEEIGGANGAKKLAEAGYLPKILINGDGGYNYAVIHAEKGILKIKLSTQSESGRHPYPWDGQNAFDLLVRDYRQIMHTFEEQKLATEDNNWFTTYSSYDIKVENEPSFAPHYAEMKINIYFTEDVTADEMFEKIRKIVRFAKVEKLTASERVYLPPDDEHVLTMRDLMQTYFQHPIEIRAENGSSDARFFTNKGIPIVIVKVLGENHHGPDEHLYIPGIMPMYRSLRAFLQTYGHDKIKAEPNETVFQHS